MNTEQERTEFEAWYRMHHGSIDVYGRDASGEYADKQVQGAFNVWQARAALAASAEHANCNLQLATQEPVACAFFTEKGEVTFTGIYYRTLKALERVKRTRMGISSGSIDLYASPVAALAQENNDA